MPVRIASKKITPQAEKKFFDLKTRLMELMTNVHLNPLRIEELIQCPVALLSTSPERDDTILVTDPFAD